jgi:hypothetical protein
MFVVLHLTASASNKGWTDFKFENYGFLSLSSLAFIEIIVVFSQRIFEAISIALQRKEIARFHPFKR